MLSEHAILVASPVSTQPWSPSIRKLHEPVFNAPSQALSRITNFTPFAYRQFTWYGPTFVPTGSYSTG